MTSPLTDEERRKILMPVIKTADLGMSQPPIPREDAEELVYLIVDVYLRRFCRNEFARLMRGGDPRSLTALREYLRGRLSQPVFTGLGSMVSVSNFDTLAQDIVTAILHHQNYKESA